MKRPESLPQHQWVVAPPLPATIFAQFPHLSPPLLQVLYNRGLQEAAHIQAFIDGRYLESTDPFLLADMQTAVNRIQQAIEQDETIIVYGDFDADGVTATVLLTEALRGVGVSREKAQPYIPDRVDEGYGLNAEALRKLKEEKGAGLVISVDCGIRSVAEAAYAREIGLDMIITDHHSLGAELPDALAVINPKRPDSQYPEKMLAGVGIAFKLAQALKRAMPDRAHFDESNLLDLVAIGTIADLAPLLGENRHLVLRGLMVMNAAKRPGVAALARVSGLKPGHMTAESVAFALGPRINAAGRLAHAYSAAKLLAINNDIMATQLANELNELNKKRQKMTADLTAKAEAMIDPSAWLLMVADEEFAPGIVGLVAGRLTEKYYRPSIILEKGEEESRASCRSIPEFHITEALDKVADLLVRHGGHSQAAGFTVLNENLPLLTEKLLALAREGLANQALASAIYVDVDLPLWQVDWALFEQLAQLEPTGYANPTPILMSRNVEVISHRVVGDGSHLQLQLSSGGKNPLVLGGIAFRQAVWAGAMPQMIDVVYTVGVNEWNGRRNLQLLVQDLRPSQA